MATRTYARAGLQFSEPHLAALLNAALGLTGCVTQATATTILVTHPTLSATHDAGVASVLSSYVFDPDFGVAPETLALRGKLAVLRQWASDGRDEVLAWDSQTQAQKNAANKIVIDRLAKFFDNFADFLAVTGQGS